MSERKEDLAARMRLVKAALDSEPVAVAIIRAPELRYLYANQEMRRLVGRDITGELHTDAWPVSVLERLTSVLRRVERTGEAWIERDTPWDLPRYPGANAEQMFLTFEVTRVELGEGTYLLITVTETTDEVVMRQQRDVMSQRMSEVLESVSDAVFAVDAEWRLTYANGRMAELCEATRDDLIGSELWGALPDARDTAFERSCRHAMTSRERVRLEGDGKPFGTSYTAKIYPAENGLVVYVTDTTERVKSQRALEEAHKRFDRVLDGTTDGFYIFDRDWRFVHVNRQVADNVGMRKEDLIGKHALELFRIDPDSPIVDEFMRSMQTGIPADFTAYYEGTELWYEFRTIPFGDQIAVFVRDVTEQRTHHERVEAEARFSAALNAIDADINSTLDFDQIMNRMIEDASEVLDTDLSLVTMLDDDGWLVTHSHGPSVPMDGNHFQPHELPHATAALEARSTIVIDDPRVDPRVDREIAEAMGLGSMLVVPLQRGDEVFGAILFNRAMPPRPFSEEEAEFGRLLGQHVSLAVENAWLLERERTARQRAADEAEVANLLLTAAESLGSSLSIDEVTSTLQGFVARAAKRHRVTILRREPKDGSVEVLATSCPGDHAEHRRYLSVLFSPALNQVFETARPSVVDFRCEEHTPPGLRAAAEECEIVNVLFVPIRRGAEMTGALAIDEPGSAEPFSDREVDLVAGLAAEAAAAIENAHLYAVAQEVARYSEALNEIDVDINSSLDFATVMRRTIERASQILEADSARVGMLEAGTKWRITHTTGEVTHSPRGLIPLDALPHARMAVHSKRAVVISDTALDPRVDRTVMKELGIGSVLVVPLLRGDETLGVLIFNRHRRAQRFTDAQVDFARKLAAHVSLAVHNSRLYQQQRDIADTLQEALLVMPERVDGVEFAHIYRSAAEAARVGGDFYDLFSIDDHTAGIVIGDVSGKGLDAAVMTSLARNTIRAYSAERMAASSVIERASDIVLATSEHWVFMSVFYGVMDFEHSVLSYCNAGHPAPVILSPDGTLRPLEPTAAIAGAFKGAVYGQSHVPMTPGDTLVLYTDGLVEARRNGEMYGEERLHEALGRAVGMHPDDLVNHLITDAERFARALNDDVAVMAVRICAR